MSGLNHFETQKKGDLNDCSKRLATWGGFGTQIRRGHCSASMHIDWQVPYADREEFRGGRFPAVPPICSSGHCPDSTEEVAGLEGSNGSQDSRTGLKHLLLVFQTIVQTIQDRFLRIAQAFGGLGHLEPSHGPSGHYGERLMALLSMEPQGKTDDGHGQGPHHHAEHGVSDRRAGGTGLTARDDSETEMREKKDGNRSPVSPWLIQLNPRKERIYEIHSALAHNLLGLGAGGGSPSTGLPIHQDAQQRVQKEALAGWLTSLRLANEGNCCYQNSVTLTFL